MAVDEAAADRGRRRRPRGVPLRLYQWNEPTLSLGYFSRYDDRHITRASRDCAIVRRQSGGGAIHDRAHLQPHTSPPANIRSPTTHTALYNAIHNSVHRDYSPLPVGAAAPNGKLALHQGDMSRAPRAKNLFLCFLNVSACGDLLLSQTGATSTTSFATTPRLRA